MTAIDCTANRVLRTQPKMRPHKRRNRRRGRYSVMPISRLAVKAMNHLLNHYLRMNGVEVIGVDLKFEDFSTPLIDWSEVRIPKPRSEWRQS